MPIPALVDGALPLGRWPATEAEIEASFVTGHSAKRVEIWGHWQQTNSALQHAVPVAAAWLGGSFFTDKEQPGDIDCLYVIEWAALAAARLDPRKAQFLQIVAANQVKSQFGLLVDSFVLEWWPSPGPARPEYVRQYLENRGYWDDLWSRRRSVDTREDSVPRNGYLEVIVNGYA